MLYSSWEEIEFEVSQESILGPLLFKIFLLIFFFFFFFLIMKETGFSSYADDNTPYSTADTFGKVIKLLERESMMFKWFSDNQMKVNLSKCHLLVNKKDEVVMNLGEMEIKNN